MDYRNSDYYTILGLARDASAAEVELAYMTALRDWPAGSEEDESPRAYMRLAYDVLSNPQRRQLYDSLLAGLAAPSLDVRVQVSRREVDVLDAPQTLYLLAQLSAPDQPDSHGLPLNLCLVIDRSTSMAGERLQQAQEAVRHLLGMLAPADVLSLVVFSDRAAVVLPARPLGQHHEPAEALASISASGGTEIYHGLAAGVQQMRQVSLAEYHNHLILLTDGYTYGDARECLRIAEESAAVGIIFSAFGLGTDWDDHFLDALVAPSGGSAEHITGPEEVVAALAQRLQGLGSTYARRVRLATTWPERVQLEDAIKLTPFVQTLDFEDREISLGDMQKTAPLTFLLEFLVLPHPIPARLRIPLQFQVEIGGEGEKTLAQEVVIDVVTNPREHGVPQAVLSAARLLVLYRLNEKAWHEAEAGHLAEAAVRLDRLATRFLEAGAWELARYAEDEGRRLARDEALSTEARLRLKYGTRSLAAKTIQLQWDEAV